MVKAGTPQGLNYARTDAQVAEVGIKELTASRGGTEHLPWRSARGL